MSVVVANPTFTIQNLTQENERLRQENLQLRQECERIGKIAKESFNENQRNLDRLSALEKAFGEFQQTSLRRVNTLDAKLDKSKRIPFWTIGCVVIIGGGVYLAQNFDSLREKIAKYF